MRSGGIMVRRPRYRNFIKNIPSKLNDFTDILFFIMRKRKQKKRILKLIHGPC